MSSKIEKIVDFDAVLTFITFGFLVLCGALCVMGAPVNETIFKTIMGVFLVLTAIDLILIAVWMWKEH